MIRKLLVTYHALDLLFDSLSALCGTEATRFRRGPTYEPDPPPCPEGIAPPEEPVRALWSHSARVAPGTLWLEGLPTRYPQTGP